MLYLASQSPRRRDLLVLLGLAFATLDIDVPEVRQHREPPDDYVSRVAREKAGAGLLQVVAIPGAWVLGADTEVILEGEVFGKPCDRADAARMLRRLAGRTHTVVSTVWLMSAGRELHATSRSLVTLAPLTNADIEHYVDTSECDGKAGAYAIQGRAQAFITALSGSYSGVMGLPLHETAKLLAEAGLLPDSGAVAPADIAA